MTDTAVIFDIIGRDKTSSAIAASGNAFNKFAIGLAAGAAFAGAKFVDMAANFQQGMTRLKTGAGEVDSNMSLVSKGILTLAGQVGESTKDLLSGMYLVESAGFHGAEGLNVLTVAAKGAKVGNADMATVADAVTTGLNAYRMSADKAAQVTNALVAAEGQGKTNLEALSGSLATVAPIASVAGVKLNEVLGAMATMTGEGTDAASAATYLKQTIGNLANPSQKAAHEMEGLGIHAIDVQHALGNQGLAAALGMLTDAIQKKMGPGGDVIIEKLRKSTGNATAFQQILANLPPTIQTYVGALATMTGGTKSMQAALELTGANMQVFQQNTDVINQKVKAGGNTIEGWADVQKNFNQQMAEAKGKTEALGIAIGQALMPYALQVVSYLSNAVSFLGRHAAATKIAAEALLIGAGAFLAWRVAATAANVATKAWMVATNIWKGLSLVAAAAQWVWNASLLGFPLVWIILAFAAVVAAVILVIKYHKQIGEFFVYIWGKIWDFMKGVGAWFAGPFANFFVKMGKDVAAPFIWLWHNIIEPVWKAIETVIGLEIRIVVSYFNLWKFVIMNVIVPALMWLWHNAIEPVFKGIADISTWLWHNIIEPWALGVAAVYMWVYKNVLVPIGEAFAAAYHGIAEASMWVWHNVIEPTVHGIGGAFSWLYHSIIEPVFGFIMSKVREVGSVFHEVFDVLGSIISAGFEGAISGVKWVINGLIDIINGAIGGVDSVINTMNKVPGVDFPTIDKIPHLASGGVITRSGAVRVGERGAETVTLPAGAAVYPNGSQPAGAGGRTVTFHGNVDSAFATYFKQLVRQGMITIN